MKLTVQGSEGRVRHQSEAGISGGRKRQSDHNIRYDSHYHQHRLVRRISLPVHVLCSHHGPCIGALRLKGDRCDGYPACFHSYTSCSQRGVRGLEGRNFLQLGRDTAGFHSESFVHSIGWHNPRQPRMTFLHKGSYFHRHCTVFGLPFEALYDRRSEEPSALSREVSVKGLQIL